MRAEPTCWAGWANGACRWRRAAQRWGRRDRHAGVASDLSGKCSFAAGCQAEASAIGEPSRRGPRANNPLTVIRGYAQLLQGMGVRHRWPRLAAIAGTPSVQPASCRILTFAREKPPARDVVDLNAVLQSVLDMRERPLLPPASA